ncbi:hypothetical protein ACFJIX_06060 [Roseateles sp. UC29_93]|uniref:hypothetical protein n=1 Tax=Roseateles sp. UC29_93 TaxID=3350177 RepID=UPI003672E9A5
MLKGAIQHPTGVHAVLAVRASRTTRAWKTGPAWKTFRTRNARLTTFTRIAGRAVLAIPPVLARRSGQARVAGQTAKPVQAVLAIPSILARRSRQARFAGQTARSGHAVLAIQPILAIPARRSGQTGLARQTARSGGAVHPGHPIRPVRPVRPVPAILSSRPRRAVLAIGPVHGHHVFAAVMAALQDRDASGAHHDDRRTLGRALDPGSLGHLCCPPNESAASVGEGDFVEALRAGFRCPVQQIGARDNEKAAPGSGFFSAP